MSASCHEATFRLTGFMERPGGKFLEVGGTERLAGEGFTARFPSYLSAQSHKISHKIFFVYFAASFNLENVRSQFHSLRQKAIRPRSPPFS
jgi:hypothetical protein